MVENLITEIFIAPFGRESAQDEIFLPFPYTTIKNGSLPCEENLDTPLTQSKIVNIIDIVENNIFYVHFTDTTILQVYTN